MAENKFWAFVAIGLAFVFAFYKDVGTVFVILLGISIVIFCYIISYIWNKFIDSNHKWVDAIFFLFSKNKLSYIVDDKIINYNIIDEKNATYDLKCNIVNKSSDSNFCYKGRYYWNQNEDISVSVSNGFTYKCSEDFKWSNIDIIPKDRIIHKGDRVTCGFCLNNLYISKLIKQSYLSCKMIEKVKHLKMIATVPNTLKPTANAIFIVQNSLGDEISREDIPYNKHTATYEKTVVYPRRGRKYIIKWDYDN